MLLVLGLPALYIFVVFRPDDISFTEAKIPNLNGARIEVVFTNSDGFAKSNWIDVYFEEASCSSKWKRLCKKTSVFRYDPETYNEQEMLPEITAEGPNSIRIRLAGACELLKQETHWKNLRINYDIGPVTYPTH